MVVDIIKTIGWVIVVMIAIMIFMFVFNVFSDTAAITAVVSDFEKLASAIDQSTSVSQVLKEKVKVGLIVKDVTLIQATKDCSGDPNVCNDEPENKVCHQIIKKCVKKEDDEEWSYCFQRLRISETAKTQLVKDTKALFYITFCKDVSAQCVSQRIPIKTKMVLSEDLKRCTDYELGVRTEAGITRITVEDKKGTCDPLGEFTQGVMRGFKWC